MGSLDFVNEQNQVAFLQTIDEKSGLVFHQIVDFLNATHIRYALTVNPTSYISQIKKFWEDATVITIEHGDTHTSVQALKAIVDGVQVDVTESSLRRVL